MDIIDELRSYRVETDLASWHPEICDRAADCITDLMARCDRLEEARENANEACAKWEGMYHLDRLRELLEACKGLEPSEIAESKLLIATRKDPEKLARMAELVEADREGRCVVLPCKVEDDVYINILGKTLPFTVISISQMASTPTFKAQHGIRLVYIFKADDVGETVFMTREEAEAALKGEQGQ